MMKGKRKEGGGEHDFWETFTPIKSLCLSRLWFSCLGLIYVSVKNITYFKLKIFSKNSC